MAIELDSVLCELTDESTHFTAELLTGRRAARAAPTPSSTGTKTAMPTQGRRPWVRCVRFVRPQDPASTVTAGKPPPGQNSCAAMCVAAGRTEIYPQRLDGRYLTNRTVSPEGADALHSLSWQPPATGGIPTKTGSVGEEEP